MVDIPQQPIQLAVFQTADPSLGSQDEGFLASTLNAIRDCQPMSTSSLFPQAQV